MEDKEKVRVLLETLFDPNAIIEEKDNAAMDLQLFNDDTALDGLIRKAQDQSEDEMVLVSCGESIAIIWLERDFFDLELYRSFAKDAHMGAYDVIESAKPEWVDKYHLAEEWEKIRSKG